MAEEYMKLLEEFIPDVVSDRVCMLVEIDENVIQENIAQTSVYNIDHLMAALKKIRSSTLNKNAKIQMRFVTRKGVGIILLMKLWDESNEKMYPAADNQYIGLAPVNAGVNGDGFKVWNECRTVTKTVIETVEVPVVPLETYQNHTKYLATDDIKELLGADI